jgi:Plasmid encoded RepA protein
VLTDDYYYSLKDHAIPFDFRALKAIQAKPRAQDIYLWMTQRLCRIDKRKPLLLRWHELHEMFGGQSSPKRFKQSFPEDLRVAHLTLQRHFVIDTSASHFYSASRSATTEEEAEDVTSLSDRT